MTKKIERQPIWESSSRPLYPKCVWVEGAGYRHFILDHDINKRRTSYQNNGFGISTSSGSCPTAGGGGCCGSGGFVKKSISCDIIDAEIENLQLIGSSDIPAVRRASHMSDDVSSAVLAAGRQPCRRHAQATNKSNFNLIKRQLNKRFPVNKSMEKQQTATTSAATDLLATTTVDAKPENCYTTKDIEHLNLSKNQLTERVLQWLDLAGRNTIVRSENELKKLAPRRICTAESLKKSSKPPSYTPTQLKRTESLHHLSLTFNEDETYMAQSQMDKEKATSSFGEFFPTTYRCSRAFLSNRHSAHQQHKLSRPPSASNVTATTVPAATPSHPTSPTGSAATPNTPNNKPNVNNNNNNNSNNNNNINNSNQHQHQSDEEPVTTSKSNGKSKKQDKNIDNQYRALIQRQILEKSCNTQLAKRQLHIFMPNLPKKKLQSSNGVVAGGDDAGGAGGECESSCLSTIISNISK